MEQEKQLENQLEMQLQRYRHEVHCYLDVLWLIATDKSEARKTWYTYLANNLGKTEEENHVSKYSLDDCKKALILLKPKYKQLTGKKNMPYSIRRNFDANKWNKYYRNLSKIKGR